MSVQVSPLDLILDVNNPRFVFLNTREQADIRKYLVAYEDVCMLARSINDYGGLLPGERVVVLLGDDGHYVVVEGNRRTCSLQMLLSRDLIPDGFDQHIPQVSSAVLSSCQKIEVDVLSDRNAALGLMTKRHIQGVRQWKPLAKKQFFASNYNDGNGQSVRSLSQITSVTESEIKRDIQDYKFFVDAYQKFSSTHPEFTTDIIGLKTDPFWRVFNTKFKFRDGREFSPKKVLQIYYDPCYNTVSKLPTDLFERIVQHVFEQAIVRESITTRNCLSDVPGIMPLLESAIKRFEDTGKDPVDVPLSKESNTTPYVTTQNENRSPFELKDEHANSVQVASSTANNRSSAGGPPPRKFFEALSWENILTPANASHQGLLHAVNELYKLSTKDCSREKAYYIFPVAAGMLLRTAYEQSLCLRLKQMNLWGELERSTEKKGFPTLKAMEDFIKGDGRKQNVFPGEMLHAFDQVIAARHREFLNANIHQPGNIWTTPGSLEAIAAGGMFVIIQGIINLLSEER